MQAADLAQRLKNILEALTWDIFSYVCLGLFEQHKLMFAFQITCKIMQQEGLLDPAELDFFIKGKLSLDAAPQAKPAAWIPDQVGKTASRPPHHRPATTAFSQNEMRDWKELSEGSRPESCRNFA